MNQFDHHKKGMITFIYEPFAILFPSFLLPYGWMSWAKTMATAFLFLCVEKLFKWVNEKNTFFRYLQGYGIWEPMMPGLLSLELKRLMEKLKDNNTTTQAHQQRTGPSLIMVQVNQGLHKWALNQGIAEDYNRSNINNLNASKCFKVILYTERIHW